MSANGYTREEKNALNLRYYHERKERIKKAGICRSCTRSIGTKSTVFCDPCFEKATAARRARTGAMPRMKAPEITCERCGQGRRGTKENWNFNPDGCVQQPCKTCLWAERKAKKLAEKAKVNKKLKTVKTVTGPKRPPRRKIKEGNAPINYGLLTTMAERAQNPWGCLAQDVITIAVLEHQQGQCEPEFWESEIFELCCDAIGWHPDYIKRNIGANNAAR